MDTLSKHLIALLKRMYNQEGQNEESQLVREQFKAMENRYHTWMNYYSLFNGALLVAYCTLLVSTGWVIQQQFSCKTTYKLECGYWDFLIMIAFLGIVASYCWLLSMIGHNHWLNNWRQKLQGRYPNIMNDISVEDSLVSQLSNICGKRVLPGFYSTAKITQIFIWTVITAWIMIFIYSISKYIKCDFSIFCIGIISLIIAWILCIFRHIIHYILGSNLNRFTINRQTIPVTDNSFCKKLKYGLCPLVCCIAFIIFIAAIIFFILLLGQDCCTKCSCGISQLLTSCCF